MRPHTSPVCTVVERIFPATTLHPSLSWRESSRQRPSIRHCHEENLPSNDPSSVTVMERIFPATTLHLSLSWRESSKQRPFICHCHGENLPNNDPSSVTVMKRIFPATTLHLSRLPLDTAAESASSPSHKDSRAKTGKWTPWAAGCNGGRDRGRVTVGKLLFTIVQTRQLCVMVVVTEEGSQSENFSSQ